MVTASHRRHEARATDWVSGTQLQAANGVTERLHRPSYWIRVVSGSRYALYLSVWLDALSTRRSDRFGIRSVRRSMRNTGSASPEW
jgi:hypothetical protein